MLNISVAKAEGVNFIRDILLGICFGYLDGLVAKMIFPLILVSRALVLLLCSKL